MTYKEEDIMHENGAFWVLRVPFHGRTMYEVYETGITHSVRCGMFDLGERGLARAIAECDRREEARRA